MATVKATRSKTIRVYRDIEIVSRRLVTESLDAQGSGSMWIMLKRKCCVCGQKFKDGDAIEMCMYIEDGQQASGGAHQGCLDP